MSQLPNNFHYIYIVRFNIDQIDIAMVRRRWTGKYWLNSETSSTFRLKKPNSFPIVEWESLVPPAIYRTSIPVGIKCIDCARRQGPCTRTFSKYKLTLTYDDIPANTRLANVWPSLYACPIFVNTQITLQHTHHFLWCAKTGNLLQNRCKTVYAINSGLTNNPVLWRSKETQFNEFFLTNSWCANSITYLSLSLCYMHKESRV